MNAMKPYVIVPTYNEAPNIDNLIRTIRGLEARPEVIVADDNSPDGTWKVVEEISKGDPGVHIIRRMSNRSRTWAAIEAFRFALDREGGTHFIEMDGDFSHDPLEIPKLLEGTRDHDIAVGSRLVAGGGQVGRPWLRELITQLSTAYARAILRLPILDCNSGFRCFRRSALERLEFDQIISLGPSFLHETYHKANLAGMTFIEVPITFHDRRLGKSKFGLRNFFDGALMAARIRAAYGIPPKK
ncbi:polyprenol monophosphomannose synthase [Thermodesulfobacteriota bacterium]